MGATTVLPPPRLARRTASLADIYSRAPRVHINAACMVNAAAVPMKPKRPSSVLGVEPEPPAKHVRGASASSHFAASVDIGDKKPKRPSSVLGGEPEPPAKRARGGASPHLAAAAADLGNKNHPCPSRDKDARVSLIKNQTPVQPPVPLPESTAQPKPPSLTMHELIARARQAKARPSAEKAAEIERRRREARQKVEQIVATVEFNDPFLDFVDVFMSPQQLREAREAAADFEARILAMYR